MWFKKNLSKVFTVFCLGGRVQHLFSFPEIFYGIPFWNWQRLIKQSMSSLPGNRCNNYHIKFPFLYSAVLFPVSSGWIKKRAPLPSASLYASQGNVTGFKAVKSLAHRLTGVSLASWQALLGNRCYASVGGGAAWISACTYMHMHTRSFRLCKNFTQEHNILRKSGRIWDDVENIKRLTVKTERHETEGESCTGTMQTAIEQDLQSGCKDQRAANVLNRS